MDRRRDIPPEDRYGGGGGQSYRPGIARRTPPPRREREDTYGARSPLGRPYDSRGLRGRSRSPPPYRRRSPSRDRFGPRGGDSYRARPRSPPRDDLFRRDFRDDRPRDFGRGSPRFRDRSPPIRARSPFRRSPRRERSPRRYDSRPQSTNRRPVSSRQSDRDYPSRPRSPPSRAETNERMDWQRARSERADVGSGATSRRSSPHVHASRLALVLDAEDTHSSKPSPRTSEYRAAATPEQKRIESPKRDKDGDVGMANTQEIVKARQDAPAPERAPPSRPSERPFVPPAGPRGDASNRGGFSGRGRGYGDYPVPGRSSITATFRGGRGGASYARGPSYERESSFAAPVAPAASRNFSAPVPRPAPVRTASTTSQFDSTSHEAPRAPAISVQSDAYRRPPAGPSAAPTGPSSERTARPVSDGVHPALRDLPEVIPNGRRLPPIADQSRLVKLEEEAERLRKMIQEKDARKRRGLREWDRLVREGESAAYRCEVAEGSVRAFDGDGERAGAAF